ncbi:MAG: FAD-dependent thymidylate synthase, partial [Clostridia bacterium]|nr:FAD-dependent thymidylate synthase [Clostridia bacterium]
DSAVDIMTGLPQEKIESLLKKLLKMGHLSPFEHVSFTFAVEGVSRALTHQLVRHRIASYSQRSQRYVSEKNFEYIIPHSILKNEKALKTYRGIMEKIRDAYRELEGLVPKEDARYVLPNACETKIVYTFNARSLLNFFRLRCCERAQWEIRELAHRMLEEVREVAPLLFQYAGAPCEVDGRCPEGDFSCGKIAQFKNKK